MSQDEMLLDRKLLIVDDSRVSRMMIRTFFAKRCPTWSILEANSGDEAIDMAKGARPDFVTMDVNMPGINGFEAARQLLALDEKVRIVMLTANIQESSRNEAVSLHVHFVAKPATEASLQQTLNHLVGAS